MSTSPRPPVGSSQALPAANGLRQPSGIAWRDHTGTAPCYMALFRARKRYGIWILSSKLKLKLRLHSPGKCCNYKATAHRGWGGQSIWKMSFKISVLREGLWPVDSSMTWRCDWTHPSYVLLHSSFHIILDDSMTWMYISSLCAKQCLRQHTLPASTSVGLWYRHPINHQESLSPGRNITSSSILSMADLSWQYADLLRGLSLPYAPRYLRYPIYTIFQDNLLITRDNRDWWYCSKDNKQVLNLLKSWKEWGWQNLRLLMLGYYMFLQYCTEACFTKCGRAYLFLLYNISEDKIHPLAYLVIFIWLMNW